jgi:hypothetical protein
VELAIVVNNLSIGQLSYLISKQAKNRSIIVFSKESYTMNLNNGFSVLSAFEFLNYKGKNVVATDIESCKVVISNPAIEKFYFYVWDLEWMRLESFDYEDMSNVYRNEKSILVSRSERHALAIEQAWNKKSLIIEDFDIDKIIGDKNVKINI